MHIDLYKSTWKTTRFGGALQSERRKGESSHLFFKGRVQYYERLIRAGLLDACLSSHLFYQLLDACLSSHLFYQSFVVCILPLLLAIFCQASFFRRFYHTVCLQPCHWAFISRATAPVSFLFFPERPCRCVRAAPPAMLIRTPVFPLEPATCHLNPPAAMRTSALRPPVFSPQPATRNADPDTSVFTLTDTICLHHLCPCISAVAGQFTLCPLQEILVC